MEHCRSQVSGQRERTITEKTQRDDLEMIESVRHSYRHRCDRYSGHGIVPTHLNILGRLHAKRDEQRDTQKKTATAPVRFAEAERQRDTASVGWHRQMSRVREKKR